MYDLLENQEFRRINQIYKYSNNNNQFNKAKKFYYSVSHEINCCFCPYNRFENKKHGCVTKNWKRFRLFQSKNRTNKLSLKYYNMEL